MYKGRHWQSDEAEYQAEKRQTSGLIGMIIILVLLIVGLYLVQQLRVAALVEDCLLAGRNNCDTAIHSVSSLQPEP